MKSLLSFLREEGGGGGMIATGGNTMGMGNPMVPIGDQYGSEPMVSRNKKKRRNLKK